MRLYGSLYFIVFFNDTATTEIYTLSLHDALPIFQRRLGAVHRRVRLRDPRADGRCVVDVVGLAGGATGGSVQKTEEHKTELHSRPYSVWRPFARKKQDDMD